MQHAILKEWNEMKKQTHSVVISHFGKMVEKANIGRNWYNSQ